MSVSTERTIYVLEVLNRCEPRKIKTTGLEQKARIVSNWCLLIAFCCTAVNGVFVLFYETRPPSTAAMLFVLSMSLVTSVLAICALMAPVVVTLCLMFRWKKLALSGLCEDIRHEQSLADRLKDHDPLALNDARFWLERKISRLSARTGRFFGEKTAIVGLVATTFSFADSFGGFGWVSRTLAAGFSLDNVGNTLLLWVGALLVGISLGSVLLQHLAARYRYQIEILELVERRQMRGATASR